MIPPPNNSHDLAALFIPAASEVTAAPGAFSPPAHLTISCPTPDVTCLRNSLPNRNLTVVSSGGSIRMVHAETPHGHDGFTLTITSESLTFQYSPHTGPLGNNSLRNATNVLLQVLRIPAPLPCGTYAFTPRFRSRGVMLDISRTRIPTMAEFVRILDTLASLSYNHLQLYTEHTFAYVGHEAVWKGQSALTPDELRTLDSLAAQRGIELAANQNCFGHLAPWLNTQGYKHLAETHGEWMFDVWPRSGAFSLAPTDPNSLTFIAGLLDQLLPCLTSPMVNIGCDETYDIGFGKSAHAVAQRGRRAVYLEFVTKVAQLCTARGKQPQFWADMLLSAANDPADQHLIAQVPRELTALAWGYEPTSPFARWGELLQQRKLSGGGDFWVCPGTSTWRSLTGRSSERTGNLENARSAGITFGADGFLLCDWGDTGHHQTWPILLHALIAGAHAAWGVPITTDRRLAGESLHYFSGTTVPHWLESLGDVDAPLRAVCGPLSHPSRTTLLNQSAMFIDLFKAPGDLLTVGALHLWDEALDRARTLQNTRPSSGDALIDDELEHTIAYVMFALLRACARRHALNGYIPNVTLAELDTQLTSLRANHARLWKVRSRIGGLEASDAFFAQIRANLLATPAKTYEDA